MEMREHRLIIKQDLPGLRTLGHASRHEVSGHRQSPNYMTGWGLERSKSGINTSVIIISSALRHSGAVQVCWEAAIQRDLEKHLGEFCED